MAPLRTVISPTSWLRCRPGSRSAAIFFDQLGAAIVDQSLKAMEGQPASISVPSEYVSLANPERLAQLLTAFDTLAA